MKSMLILFFLFLLSTQIHFVTSEYVPKYETPLMTRITYIEYVSSSSGSGYSFHTFNIEAEIWNRYNGSVTIDHSDTCEFAVYINPIKLDDEVQVYSGLGCGDAITTVTYYHGITKKDDIMSLSVEGSNSSQLPNGEFELTYGYPKSWSYENTVTFIKTFMTISNGTISFENDQVPDNWGEVDQNITFIHTTITSCWDCDSTSSTFTQSTVNDTSELNLGDINFNNYAFITSMGVIALILRIRRRIKSWNYV